MEILNVHQRVINQPKEVIDQLIQSLATKEDKIWPKEKWPAMKFKNGLKVGSRGGHGPIRYTVKSMKANELIEFQFLKPSGFRGIHKFEWATWNANTTLVKHTISANTNFVGALQWSLGIRFLHDALLEDAFDKIENQFTAKKKRTPWNWWVKFLRMLLK